MNEVLSAAPSQERFLTPKRDDLPSRLPNLLVTPLGEYLPRDWDGYNTSGLQPTGDCVLILPDQPLEKSSGGVWLLDEYVERIAAAAESGTIIAIGSGAWFWNQDRTRRYEGMKYKVGDGCRFTRYAGQLHHGLDGLIYRIVSDKEIGGLAIPLPDSHEFYWEERKLPDGTELKPIRRVRQKSLDAIAVPTETKAIEHQEAAE